MVQHACWPSSIRSDGGPQFRGDFVQFCNKHVIRHELSAPYNPKSIGKIGLCGPLPFAQSAARTMGITAWATFYIQPQKQWPSQSGSEVREKHSEEVHLLWSFATHAWLEPAYLPAFAKSTY